MLGEENICMVSQDHYYRPRHEQPKDENGKENFDTPESVALEEFVRDVNLLKAGHPVQRQEYTYNRPDVVPRMLTFSPRPIVILEGIFVFHDPAVLALTDLKLFIEARPHVKIRRRILRDNVERGYDLHDVLYRYEKHVMPSYERFIEVHKHRADLIICNDEKFDRALEVICTYLKTKII